jgi:hypothetical protein
MQPMVIEGMSFSKFYVFRLFFWGAGRRLRARNASSAHGLFQEAIAKGLSRKRSTLSSFPRKRESMDLCFFTTQQASPAGWAAAPRNPSESHRPENLPSSWNI